MVELAQELLAGLLKSTLFVAFAAVVFSLVLYLGRVHSPTLHRSAWATAILLGWVFWSVPVAVPWYASDPAEHAAAPAVRELEYRPLDPDLVSGPAVLPAGDEAQRPSPADVLPPAPQRDASMDWTVWDSWPLAVVVCWLLGLVGCAAHLSWCYRRLVRVLPRGETAEAPWQQEWQEVLRRAGVSTSIPLRVTEEFGPALCRLPGGYVLAIPADLWRALTREQRLAILAHELAHYQRGDVWKSFSLQLLALPHWFNPLSWYAVRRFEECGEWACDETVRRSHPDQVTSYAKALLKLGQMAHADRLLSTAARGGGLGIRVRRLLTHKRLEDSKMKKLLVGVVAVVLVMICAVRLQLVAQDHVGGQVGESAAPNRANLETAKDMLEAAEETYKAFEADYAVGKVLLKFVYPWSRRWLDAELLVIEAEQSRTPEEVAEARAEAFRDHLERIEKLHAQVTVLYTAGAIGGEPSRYYATKYYVAEAKLWLQRAIRSQRERESLENGNTGDHQGPNAPDDHPSTTRDDS